MISPKVFADSALQLLQADPANYRNYGMYWFLVKRVIKQFHTRDNLYLLGDYEDASVNERIPAFDNLGEALQAAAEEYRYNVTFNNKSPHQEDDQGDPFVLFDSDAGL